MSENRDEVVRRIEDAPSGLAYVMRKHDAVFYRESGSEYIIDVPRRSRSGKPDHRVYERWTISKREVQLMTDDLDSGVPPMRFDARPANQKAPARSLKGWGGKRTR
jgi:hypothetical protein